MAERACKDCRAAGRALTRPAPYPGPRCSTDHRAVLRARRTAQHDRGVTRVYGMASGDYSRIHAAQGGVCAGCRRATGGRRRLAVDHDHDTGEVRGLLCATCNQILGHFRDDPVLLIGLALYLINPPARVVLGREVCTMVTGSGSSGTP